MDAEDKRENAIHFIASLQDMPPGRLEALIRDEAGESLSAFFASYAAGVIKNQPEVADKAASTLMMLGYLIRAAEDASADGAKAPDGPGD